MIKVDRTDKPIELTEEVQRILTEKFKNNKNETVWRKTYIVDKLLNMFNCKCCYCETKIDEEAKEMQVEHYHNKDKYPDEVVEWDNLLPSCRRCNTNKGTHDTVKTPILNPTINNPKEYLYVKDFRYKSKGRNELGLETIRVLYLNDTDKLVKARFKICNALYEKLEDIGELLDDYIKGKNTSTRRKNRIVNGIKDVLRCAQPTEEYSAIVSSAIINDDTYKIIKKKLIENNLWDEDLKCLENTSKNIMLDVEGKI